MRHFEVEQDDGKRKRVQTNDKYSRSHPQKCLEQADY